MAAKKRKKSGFRAAAARKARARKRAGVLAQMKRLNASRVHLDRGGYAPDGKYYGSGKPLYRVISKEEDYPDGEKYGYVRAFSSAEAKREAVERPGHWGIRTHYPS